MKVVLFCGGLGTRIRDAGENVPKPMITIGYRPVLWHVMRYYAHFGHKDFVLCLGHRGDIIKDYFLNYNECLSNDFVLSEGGKKLELMGSDIQDWKITFVETGAAANIGQRLKAVERLVVDEPEFLVNYSDGLSDVPLPLQLEHFRRHEAIASFVSVKPNVSYHLVSTEPDGHVASIEDIGQSRVRINGGFFILRREIFDRIHNGEELVREPFHRLVCERRLVAYEYDGFWMAMDTFKDRQQLEEIYSRGGAPWEVWNRTAMADAAALIPCAL
ncbi:MAG: glucose-1-phosphate cytidylyltransferase [Acidobacteria bacterium RIFCSPLOWO2_12_FULL_65_11]|nr:MAG: glucose-1-phosphate cytidylyltransferase [Acidobacteria bacterium RIFCSPLOWO2_02_FULL_64_15]OFW28305.1 MAG: glucose-1-phosphate cytidylyltransferase [Acidobacteria bacterium RIFCSPLOWO2_12_FULL_65_11]